MSQKRIFFITASILVRPLRLKSNTSLVTLRQRFVTKPSSSPNSQGQPSSPLSPKRKSIFKILWGLAFGPKYLLTTNVVSAGILMAIGDMTLQEINYQRGVTKEKERCDWWRVTRMFVVGSLQGPLHHYFYKYLDDKLPIATTKTAILKILADQFVMSPVCIFLFFYPACLLEGKNIEQSNKELQQKFLTVYAVDWLLWPVAQFINFYYLHPRYRVIYVNIVTMVYNVFLSYIKHKNM